MITKLYTAPTVEPISAADLKDHLRIYGESFPDDIYINAVITAAREYVEQYTSRALLNQTWDAFLDAFPVENYFCLPYGKCQSVSSLSYKDYAGTTTTMTVTTQYLVNSDDDRCGKIVLPYGVQWPTPSAYYPYNPIACRYVCGYGATASTVPQSIRNACLIVAAELYNQREITIVGLQVSTVKTVEMLLANYRLWQ